MKYYAVTDDPNELLHYGRLGMKWGQHIFVGTKSLAYKNAMGKLRKSAGRSAKASTKSSGSHKTSRLKSAIQKSRTQRAINRQKKQEAKFNKAVEKAQNRIRLTENMSNLDHLKAYEKRIDHDYKIDAFNAKTAAKRERVAEKMNRKYAKNEAKMDKYTQLAREGRLKYGKLSPEQVDRITNRLAIERTARQLGNTEKPKFRTRMKDAVQEGILQGVVQGTAAGMREVAIDKVQNRLRNKRVLDKANRNEAKRQKEATRIKNKKTRKEIREDLNQEAYEAQVEAGENVFQRSRILHPFTNAGKNLQKAELYKNLHEEKLYQDSKVGKSLQEYKDKKQKLDAENAIKKRLYEAEAYNDENLKSVGARLRELEDKQRERKRLQDIADKINNAKGLQEFEDAQHERKRKQDLQDKIRNEEDEAWNKYVKEGGTTHILDNNTKAIINLNDANSNVPSVREQRNRVLAEKQRQDEAAEKQAYKKRVSEETRRIKQEQLTKAKEDSEKRFDRDTKKWEADEKADREAINEYNQKLKEEKAKHGWDSTYTSNIKPPTLKNTKKPNHNDYVVDPKSFKYDLPKIESYDERKTLIELGIPTYFPYEKKNNNGGKKGGNRK